MYRWLISLYVICLHEIYSTIDVNISELEYLALKLDPVECRRLTAALHFTSYELPTNIAEAERKVDESIPCLEQLLHWNSNPTEGKGKTHEAIVHRLRQINRNDLADWLGKTTFRELGKDLDRAIDQPFRELGIQETEVTSLTTKSVQKFVEDDDDSEFPIDTVLVAILSGLLATLLTLMCITITRRIVDYCRKSKYSDMRKGEDGNEDMWKKKRRGSCSRKCTKKDDSIQILNDTDTELD